MSDHPTDFKGDILEAIRSSVTEAITGARVEAQGGGGHYTLTVTSEKFAGLTMLASQRLVYKAIAHLMNGAAPPIHAVDSLTTKTA